MTSKFLLLPIVGEDDRMFKRFLETPLIVRNDTVITVTGKTLCSEITICYQPDQIVLEHTEINDQKWRVICDNWGESPDETTRYGPEIAAYFWSLWNGIVPPWNEEVYRTVSYVIGFYLPFDPALEDIFDDYDRVYCDMMIPRKGPVRHRFYWDDDSMYLDNGSRFIAYRHFMRRCVSWRTRLLKKQKQELVNSIKYLPCFSVEYQRAKDSYIENLATI